MIHPRLKTLIDQTPIWLRSGGPESDVVISSRIRLARNLAGEKFPQQMAADAASQLCADVRQQLGGLFDTTLEAKELREFERDFLIERSLASRDLLEAPRATLLSFGSEESFGLLVNEEDHFRLQALRAGLDLDEAWDRLRPLSRELGERFELARHARYGYLTACPTNVGTGLRASLLLHLPALARARVPLQRALQAAQKSFLAVRGVHGEGSGALGHLYQISNQRTLGQDIRQQVRMVAEFGKKVAKYERDVRATLVTQGGNRSVLQEDVGRALALLREATRLESAQALECLSTLRLASLAEMGDEIDLQLDPDELLFLTYHLQRGHLQLRVGSELDPAARDVTRARLLRESLGLN